MPRSALRVAPCSETTSGACSNFASRLGNIEQGIAIGAQAQRMQPRRRGFRRSARSSLEQFEAEAPAELRTNPQPNVAAAVMNRRRIIARGPASAPLASAAEAPAAEPCRR